jgi:hypothetical protein
MNIKHVLIINVFLFFFCFLCNCEKETDPISSSNPTYQTQYGSVTQIDSYPLFTLNYIVDYKFDEYLQLGNFPQLASTQFNPEHFCCTCFSVFGEDNRYLGRNYDWSEQTTYYVVFTNPDDAYASISTVDLGFFGYDTNKSPSDPDNQKIIQILPYWPFDGINEHGVAVGMNALDMAQAPYDASRVTIGELQMIRLILDYAASTDEAINLIQQYNIRMETPPIHYLIADSSGKSVIIEFVNGRMELIENTEPWQVTTNFIVSGLTSPDDAPSWRYRTAYNTLNNHNGSLSEDGVKNLLYTVSVSSTRWSAVFDLKRGSMQIAMGRDFDHFYHFSIR